MSWNDERVEQLRKLWLEGLSASQIAAELANGITRNAVIGKVHRLGLSGRAKAPAPAPARPRVRQTAAPRPAIGGGAPRPAARGMAETGGPVVMTRGANALALQPMASAATTPAPAARPMAEVVIPISERVTIMELRESMCRWPMGDPTSADFRFCGAHSPIGEGPYCAYHATIAYQPAQDRRRDRNRGVPRV
jgi:GcrA cell cycle regulator